LETYPCLDHSRKYNRPTAHNVCCSPSVYSAPGSPRSKTFYSRGTSSKAKKVALPSMAFPAQLDLVPCPSSAFQSQSITRSPYSTDKLGKPWTPSKYTLATPSNRCMSLKSLPSRMPNLHPRSPWCFRMPFFCVFLTVLRLRRHLCYLPLCQLLHCLPVHLGQAPEPRQLLGVLAPQARLQEALQMKGRRV
jgi:hypothetical protein